MSDKQSEIERLREWAKHYRESARVAAENRLTWDQGWEMHLECTRQMTADPVKYNDKLCEIAEKGGTGEEFVQWMNEIAADYEREASELEGI